MAATTRPSVDADPSDSASGNFMQPAEHWHLDQIRFHINELCNKIYEPERTGNYVPVWVFELLSQNNVRQNALILLDFRSSYR